MCVTSVAGCGYLRYTVLTYDLRDLDTVLARLQKYVKTRYAPGAATKFFIFISYLPTFFMDGVVAGSAPMPAAAAKLQRAAAQESFQSMKAA